MFIIYLWWDLNMEPLGYYVPTKGKCSNLSNVNFYIVKI